MEKYTHIQIQNTRKMVTYENFFVILLMTPSLSNVYSELIEAYLIKVLILAK